MKQIYLIIIAVIFGSLGLNATDTYFPYPAIPESLPLGRPRANFYVEHFWDFCPWKSAFSAKSKMQGAFSDFAEMLPIASADTAQMAIDKLIDKVKKRPADLLELANMAEGMFYADTARLPIDMAYLPFAKAVAANKKITPAQREKFAVQASVIENSQPGRQLPPAELKLADGSTIALNDTTAGANEYILIFDTPESWSGRMQRTQLAANVSASELIAANLIKPIFIYPGTPNEKWWADNADVPANWIVAAMPEAERYIDFRVIPAIVVADSGKVITEKFMTMSHLIQACELIMNQYRNQ